MYFGQLPRRFGDRDLELFATQRAQAAIQAVASPRMQFDAEHAHCSTVAQAGLRRIVELRGQQQLQMLRVRRMHETLFPGTQRGPRPTFRIDIAEHGERQLRRKVAVLVRHVVADHLAADLVHAFHRAERGLQRDFAGMPGPVHAASPTADLMKGWKRGRLSTRASQAPTLA